MMLYVPLAIVLIVGTWRHSRAHRVGSVVNQIDFTTLDRICSVCCAGGVVQAPEWSAYFTAGSNSPEPDPSIPEEIPCGECDGHGRVLTGEGRELIAFLARHGIVAVGQ